MKLEREKKALAEKFNIKDLKTLKYFLGIKVKQNEEAGSIWIGTQRVS